jgi:hypothetical protein
MSFFFWHSGCITGCGIFLTEDKMKKLLVTIVFLFLMGFTAEAKPANPPAGFGIFFSTLNPHGSWVELDYGLVVWRPTMVRRGWAPYRAGQWIWTPDGWYWDSYEPFGHVTYHYGRWYNDEYYGWIWIPDYDWAPAWVEWRYDDVYIGWAPLPPYASFSINIGIHYTHNYYTPYHHWHFVTYRHFSDPYVYNHFVGHKYKNKIYSRTKYRTNYGYDGGRIVNRGIDVDYIRERGGRDIRTRDIERVRDYSQLERGRSRDDGKVRSFYIPKDELRKERDFDRTEIKRSERKSSLDIAKVELGERRELKRETREKDNIRNERVQQNDRSVEPRDRREVLKGRDESGSSRTDVQRERTPLRENKSEDVKVDRRTEDRKSTDNIRERKEVQTRTEAPVLEKRNERNNRTGSEISNERIQNQRNDERKRVQEENSRRNETETRIQRDDSRREVKREDNRTERKTDTAPERRNDERKNTGQERNKTERVRTR